MAHVPSGRWAQSGDDHLQDCFSQCPPMRIREPQLFTVVLVVLGLGQATNCMEKRITHAPLRLREMVLRPALKLGRRAAVPPVTGHTSTSARVVPQQIT